MDHNWLYYYDPPGNTPLGGERAGPNKTVQCYPGRRLALPAPPRLGAHPPRTNTPSSRPSSGTAPAGVIDGLRTRLVMEAAQDRPPSRGGSVAGVTALG